MKKKRNVISYWIAPNLRLMLPRRFYEPDEIFQAIETVLAVSQDEIRQFNRSAAVKEARFIAVWFLYNWSNSSYPKIGKMIARDHSTAMNAEKRMKDWVKNDERIIFKVLSVQEALRLLNN